MKFPTLDQLRARKTRKWTVYGEDVLPLWIAESDFPTAPPVKDALRDMIEAETFGYTPAASDLPEALADFYSTRYGFQPDPAGVVAVPDVVRGLLLGIQYFTRPDSAVVVPVPAYPPFLELPGTAGRERIDVPTHPDGLDLDAIEDAFRKGAGSLLLCAPNNPFGFVPTAQDLAALVELAVRYDARLLVDEIHAPLVYEGQHVVAAGLSDAAADRCLTVTAVSKAFNIAGLKCAQMILTNERDQQTYRSLTGVAKDGTGTLGMVASAVCYRQGIDHLDETVKYLAETRLSVADRLEEAVPGLRATRPAATYLMWLDFTDSVLASEKSPAQWLRTHAKVALNDGAAFGPGGSGHARLNFATSPEVLDEAITRIASACRSLA
ncbi:MalY/PatB family protein [Corynebacterium tapiri]|uniref:cysteine-S-conjugate beta-lyase n=1 Tax=Corynebacterium tapiri TaxID=1448266 RepID=A0A5C4U2J4_9CORY|nr:aminotransferase class I/II-fold pyridoxal phosphate-dependent enzyme [Corynebacterium tapiri]TNL96606.1 aminotransferase class I/II-fold pyridoxal phosphate-dependent enzyme [Corynebacterium tapiri]